MVEGNSILGRNYLKRRQAIQQYDHITIQAIQQLNNLKW